MREWYEWKQTNAHNWHLCRKLDGSMVAAIGELQTPNVQFENTSPDIEVMEMVLEKLQSLGWIE